MNNLNKDTKKIVDSNFVASVGNSWIICRSKSYPGRVYYFNTVSGEAAWNLSDAEAESAKNTTLESSHKLKLTEFPEPLESPQDYVCNENQTVKIGPPKIYNKQIINNKFTRPPQRDTSYNNFAQFNTLNPMGFAYPVVNVPANSIILAPPINTLQPNIETNFNCIQKEQTFNPSMPLSKCFQNFQNKNSARSPFNPKIFNKRNIFQKKNALNTSNNLNDLRQKILNMRNRKQNFCNSVSNATAYPLFSSKEVIDTTLEDNEISSIDSGNSDAFPEELILEIDVLALKDFFGISTDSEYWFIVADEDVLLNHTNFMIKLIQLDEKSRLVIPHIVIMKIQGLTTSVHNKASLKAASFISEALKSNVAIVDEESYDMDDYYENIFNSCLKLVNQNCDVVFISEKDMSSNGYGFSMHTMKDIKVFLVERKVNEDPKITITIPNDSGHDIFLNSSEENKSIDVSGNVNFKDSKASQIPTREKGVQTNNNSFSTDVAIQTDFDIPNPISNSANDQCTNGPTTKPLRKHRLIRRPLGSNAINNGSKATIDSKDNKILIETATNTKVNDNIIMFKISSLAMEDYLKMKSDEWVSRFVQIMEEALTQILQQDPSFVRDIPPPWTIYEASECIKRKFSDDTDIFDAASKLSNILFEIGGLRGKINNNIDPEMYMKMYSYGYYLIDALQSFISNNEDLQIAGTSLIKLLSDIQNPHLDPSNSDSFTDLESTRHNDPIIYATPAVPNEQSRVNPQKSTLVSNYDITISTKTPGLTDGKNVRKVPVSITQSQEVPKEISPVKQKTIHISPKANKEDKKSTTESLQQRKYNLRSKKLSTDTNDPLVLCPKDSFMTKLNLTNSSNKTDEDIIEPINETNSTNRHSFDDKQIKGPKIMRNFTICPEFEKRLQKNSCTFSEEEADDQKLDYEIDESVISEPDDTNEDDKIASNSYCPKEKCEFKPSESFRHFLDEVGTKVKESFLRVYSFCENSRNKLVSSVDSYQKVQIRAKAEKMGSFVESMCSSLKRILDRETNDSQEGTREILIKMGFESKDIDEKELEYYRSFISRCVVQGSILQQSLKLLIEATLENV